VQEPAGLREENMAAARETAESAKLSAWWAAKALEDIGKDSTVVAIAMWTSGPTGHLVGFFAFFAPRTLSWHKSGFEFWLRFCSAQSCLLSGCGLSVAPFLPFPYRMLRATCFAKRDLGLDVCFQSFNKRLSLALCFLISSCRC